MAYIVGQYNHNKDSGDDDSFINLITIGTAKRRQSQNDSGVSGASLNSFYDECIQTTSLSTSKYYYFRCLIKRLKTTQVFDIKLVNYEITTENNIEQHLKTITVQGGKPDEWVSIEFLFQPIVPFDCILFQLRRELSDYSTMVRYPKIAYQELGEINNLISNKIITGNISLLKIGVQSHPGLMMCINGEEIHTSRSGIYEVKNGVIPISFFSVINVANENTSVMKNWMEDIGEQCIEIEDELERGIITIDEAAALYEAMKSRSFLNTEKTILIDPFILDYMYEE